MKRVCYYVLYWFYKSTVDLIKFELSFQSHLVPSDVDVAMDCNEDGEKGFENGGCELGGSIPGENNGGNPGGNCGGPPMRDGGNIPYGLGINGEDAILKRSSSDS